MRRIPRSMPSFARVFKRANAAQMTGRDAEWNLVRISSKPDEIDMSLCDDGHILARTAPDLTVAILGNLEKNRPLLFPKPKQLTITPARIGFVGSLVAACLAMVLYTRFAPVPHVPFSPSKHIAHAEHTRAVGREHMLAGADANDRTQQHSSRARLSATGTMEYLTPLDLSDPRAGTAEYALGGSGHQSRFHETIGAMPLGELATSISVLPVEQQVVLIQAWAMSHGAENFGYGTTPTRPAPVRQANLYHD